MPAWDNVEAGAIVGGRYRVLSRLAQGGFGAVYVAEQLATERTVALKVLWPHVLGTKHAQEQFMLEARVAGRINSEHVVDVLDAGIDVDLNLTYLVMELLEGRDLGRLVREEGPLPPHVALEYLRQTALGLEKAHRYVDREGRSAPIVHRDLKPDNLFVTLREDGTPLVKILDFGIAKVLSQSTEISTDIKGTPLYMAFEQASRGPVSPATDVWAFALITFYLLTGRNYWRTANFSDGTMTQLFGEVLTLPLAAPSERAKELGVDVVLRPEFDEWFLRCLKRESSERFQSVAHAMRALAACGFSEGAPVASAVTNVAPLNTTSVGASYALRPQEARTPGGGSVSARRGRWRALGLVAGLALGGVAFAAWLASKAPPRTEAPGQATSESAAVDSRVAADRSASAPNPSREPSASDPEPAHAGTASSVTVLPGSAVPTASASARGPKRPLPVSRPKGAASPRQAGEDVYGDR